MSNDDENWRFDLLGDPIRGKGRPKHVPTEQTRKLVIYGLAMNRDQDEIALGLGITPPTLRKHYKKQLQGGRKAAAMRVEMKKYAAIDDAIDRGVLGAIEALEKIQRAASQRAALAELQRPAQKPLGKKQQELQAAEQAARGSAWENLLPN